MPNWDSDNFLKPILDRIDHTKSPKLHMFKFASLQIWKPGNARRKMIEICLVKSASTSVACWLVTKQMLGFLMLASIKQQTLRNWALRLWQEIKKSCSFRLSVSCDIFFLLWGGCRSSFASLSCRIAFVSVASNVWSSMVVSKEYLYSFNAISSVDPEVHFSSIYV